MAINKEMINLSDWFLEEKDDETKRELFVGISDAQKNLDGDFRKVQFGKIISLPEDLEEKRFAVSNEIFILALMQIGVYSDCLSNITANRVKDNFDMFVPFLPVEDISYYKSVIKDHFEGQARCVYFCYFARELYRRGTQNTNAENGQSVSDSRVLTKKNGNKLVEVLDEFKPSDINSNNNAAFINFIILPLGVIIAGIALTIISWFMK